MAASDIYDHQNGSGVMGCLYIIYFSENTTLTHCLTPTMTIPPPPTIIDPIYTKLTTHLFLHNLSHSSWPCTPSPNTHTCTHIHTSVENILIAEISIVKINCTWFDSVNSEIAIVSGSARKHPQWSKGNHPGILVWFFYEKALVIEITKPRDVEWYLLNHGRFQGLAELKQNAPILLYKNFTEVPDVSYYLEYRKTFECKKSLQQIQNPECLSNRSAVSVWYHWRSFYR